MSITDELREFASHCAGGMGGDALAAIADRIDEAIASEYVRLPKDADGEVIHIGDVMEWINDKNVIRTVSGVGAGVFFTWSKDIDRYTQCDANAYRHRHEPTVEDVLDEFFGRANLPDGTQTRAELIAEYAEKLREVVE